MCGIQIYLSFCPCSLLVQRQIRWAIMAMAIQFRLPLFAATTRESRTRVVSMLAADAVVMPFMYDSSSPSPMRRALPVIDKNGPGSISSCSDAESAVAAPKQVCYILGACSVLNLFAGMCLLNGVFTQVSVCAQRPPGCVSGAAMRVPPVAKNRWPLAQPYAFHACNRRRFVSLALLL